MKNYELSYTEYKTDVQPLIIILFFLTYSISKMNNYTRSLNIQNHQNIYAFYFSKTFKFISLK